MSIELFNNCLSIAPSYCLKKGNKVNMFLAISKVNSVQEACAKCFAAHLLKFEILKTT